MKNVVPHVHVANRCFCWMLASWFKPLNPPELLTHAAGGARAAFFKARFPCTILAFFYGGSSLHISKDIREHGRDFANSNWLQVGVRNRRPSFCPSAASWCGCRPEVQAHPYLVMVWLQILELSLQSLHHRGLLRLLMQIKSPGALARSVTKLSFLRSPHAVLCIWEVSVLCWPWLVAFTCSPHPTRLRKCMAPLY